MRRSATARGDRRWSAAGAKLLSYIPLLRPHVSRRQYDVVMVVPDGKQLQAVFDEVSPPARPRARARLVPLSTQSGRPEYSGAPGLPRDSF